MRQNILENFLKTKPKTSASALQMEGGTLVLNESNYYNAAERRLEAIRKEEFFRLGPGE